MRDLAPTGVLRVAIAVGPVPSAIYVIKDPASGTYRGVTIDLASQLARTLGVTAAFVPFNGSGEIQATASSGVWDVTFMPVGEPRPAFVDFGGAYHIPQSTYLAAPGLAIRSVSAANAGGVRIGGIKDTATFRASSRASPLATDIAVASVDDAIAVMRAGQIEPIALGRVSLAYVTQFIEHAKANGAVRRAFDALGLKTSQVAPAGVKP